jgi:hypothetical protein
MASLSITLIRLHPNATIFLAQLNAQSCLAGMSFREVEGENGIEICRRAQRLLSS